MMAFFTVLGMDIQKMIVSRGLYYELVFPVAANTDDTDESRHMLKAIVSLKQVVRRHYADPEEHMAMIYLTMKQALIAYGVLFGAFNSVVRRCMLNVASSGFQSVLGVALVGELE